MSDNPFQSPLAPLDPSASDDTLEESIRRQYLRHESSIKSVSLLYFIPGVVLPAMGVVMLAGSLLVASTASGVPWALMAAYGAFVLLIGVLLFKTGLALRQLRSWARNVAGIFACLGLLAVPIGTLINACILWLLFSQKGNYVFSSDYQRIIAATPHIKYNTSALVWCLFILLLVLLSLGLVGAVVRV